MPTINIKTGVLEVSYEGDQAFIENGLTTLVKGLSELAPSAPLSPDIKDQQNSGQSGKIGHTTSQIAHSSNAKSGPDLALAAAVHLTLAQGKEKFSRSDLNEEMKGAGSFYKETYSKNLTAIINSLVKDKRLNPIGSNIFSVSAATRSEFEKKLLSE